MPSSPLVGGCETRGRGRVLVGVERFDWATPAVNWISSRNVSRSEANLRRAFSKSTSLRPPGASDTPLMVFVLLRLLDDDLLSRPVMVPTDWRFSLRRCLERWRAVGRPSCEVGRLESVSRARSSSMVSSASGETALEGCRRSS
jgi:hypothetical protein